MTTDDIIKEEINSILKDIVIEYEQTRKASGQFLEGLEAVFSPYKATIKGYTYLAGRGKTKKKGKTGEPTLQQQILKWLKVKGIHPIKEKMKLNSLAFLIARKIHEEGTRRSEWLNIYEKVITPERINNIIKKIKVLNVNMIITKIKTQLEILTKNV